MNNLSLVFRPAVLVVEDDFLVMQDIADTLEEHGYEGLCARDGEAALAVLEKRPDIRMVFTDVNMPGRIDGVALAREIGRRWPEIAVMITSGRIGRDDPGFPTRWPFVAKPYDTEAVVRRIGAMLGFREPRNYRVA